MIAFNRHSCIGSFVEYAMYWFVVKKNELNWGSVLDSYV